MMSTPWLSFYPKNVPASISLNGETLIDILSKAEHNFANIGTFSCMGKTLTLTEIFTKARAFANYCRYELKLEKGDRLALMMPNLLQYPICLFGGLLAGLTIVNLNPLDKADSLRNELKDSEAKAIVVLENFVGELEKVFPETHLQKVIITSIGSELPWIERLIINGYLRYIKKIVPKWHMTHSIRLRQAIQMGNRYNFSPADIQDTDIAFFQYTGGTTGTPKGVMLSHRNLVANLLQVRTWMGDSLKEASEVVVTALPLYHIFSLVINCLLFTYLGGHNILVPDPRNIPSLVSVLKKTRCTCFCGVNTLFNAMLHNQHFRDMDHSHLKVIIGGGMAVQKTVADEWQKVTGTVLIQGYGLTETSPVVTINPPQSDHFTGSIGQPIPSTVVSIRDPETDKELPLGEVGDLCVKGPQVMEGYFHRPKETAETIRDGWLHTGDAAYIDEHGFVYIVDRLKDMIVVSGFNVYPAEVESEIKTIPGVNEVAVVGIPDETHGEIPKAFIVKEKDSDLTSDMVIKFCHDKMAAYKCPRIVEFIDALPKSNVGKILKKDLRSKI